MYRLHSQSDRCAHLSIRAGIALLALAAFTVTAAFAADNRPWLHIDTNKQTLSVMNNEEVIVSISNISLGRGGVAQHRFRDDPITPLGSFRVAWINDDSPYHRFYGFNYPTFEHAMAAWEGGVIDGPTFEKIMWSIRNNRLPPQDTPLGGNLGIHGLGDADRQVHQLYNWTRGCIALTNEQIDTLAPWMRLGTKVVVD